MIHNMEKDSFSKINAWSQKIREGCNSALNSLLAVHFENQNNYDEAFSQIALAVKKDPQSKNLYNKLVWISQSTEKLNQAKKLIESAISKAPENDVLRRSLGLVYILQGEYLFAIKNLRISLKFNQKEQVTHFLLGYCFLALLEGNSKFSGSDCNLLNSAQEEFQRSEDLPFFQGDSDFREGKRYLNEKSFSMALSKMESALQRIKELQVEPASFCRLALSFLMDENEVEQDLLESVMEDLRERSGQGKGYPEINNHMGLCFLIFWRKLLLEAKSQLRLAVEKDVKFQKAKTNLIFVESLEKKNSPLMKDLRF